MEATISHSTITTIWRAAKEAAELAHFTGGGFFSTSGNWTSEYYNLCIFADIWNPRTYTTPSIKQDLTTELMNQGL